MNCPDCLRPIATDEDYLRGSEGVGESLCWRDWADGSCPDPLVRADVLLKIRDELRADALDVIRRHRDRYRYDTDVDAHTAVGLLLAELELRWEQP